LTSVLKIGKDEVIYFKAYLSSRSDVVQLDLTTTDEAFRVKIGNYSLVGYNTGSIVYNSESLKGIIVEILYQIREHKLNFDIMIGSDEAGKGEWLGPLVVSAVALNPKQVISLQAEGVRDSKLIKSQNLISLSELIKSNSLGYQVISIYPKEFNDIFKQIKFEGGNLNDILAQKHFLSINNILGDDKKPEKKIRIVIDEFDKVKTEYMMKDIASSPNIEFIQKPKAEEEVAVAAASILARREREKIIDELSIKVGRDLRSLTPAEALSSPFANEIAKLSYIDK